jgi:tRNA-splicing ligase RtcB (3'-phosphate/5'-hydroxy nucleic acid ligase)
MNYNLLEVTDGVPVKMWTMGVPVEAVAQQQLENTYRCDAGCALRAGCNNW